MVLFKIDDKRTISFAFLFNTKQLLAIYQWQKDLFGYPTHSQYKLLNFFVPEHLKKKHPRNSKPTIY